MTTYTCPDGTPFEVDWPNPEMEAAGWRWDQLHYPVPVTPLAHELGGHFMHGFGDGLGATGAPGTNVGFEAHGYRFTRMKRFEGDPAVRAAWFQGDVAARSDCLLELWEHRYLPEVQALTVATVAWEQGPETSLAELCARLPELYAIRRREGELHMLVMGMAQFAGNRFLDWCNAQLGPQGERLGEQMMRGFPTKSLDSAQALWTLSREALARPAVAEYIRDSANSSAHGVLEVEGGKEWNGLFGAFLREYGNHSNSFLELCEPTWIEDPRFPLFLILRYLDAAPEAEPARLHEASVRTREEVIARTEESLAPELVAEFRRLLKSGQQRTILIEDHNFYIDQLALCAFRQPGLALGRRLAAQGSLDDADDVWYLRESDIVRASREPGLRLQQTVAAGKAERARWMRTLPPETIGSGPVIENPALKRFFGSYDKEPDSADTVTGIPGSAGMVRGTARLILSLDDVDRFQAGEILVTYATAPPWTPLFAIARGIVTDAGGALSHCAVVAREYGIPAVVGTRTATGRIADGATITVDGSAGRVRIDSEPG